MQKLKNGFRKFFLIAVVFSLMFTSCRHPAEEQNNPKTENITVTVSKDSHVKNAPKDFTLAKSSKLGFTALKEKIKPLEFEANYKLEKITLNDASGEEITDSAPYTFNENTTIFICSKKEGSPEKLELTKLKVDGKEIAIQDIMNAGKTRDEKVLIEAKSSLPDATIDYEPALDRDNFLKLEVGKKSLKIKVKKRSEAKTYTLNIERTASDIVLLKKLTIDGKSKEGTEITKEMNFTAPQDATSVDVKAQIDPEDGKIVFEPALVNDKLTLSGDETTLTIKVGTEPNVSTHIVRIKKLVAANTMVDTIFVYGGRKNGVATDVEKTETDKVLRGDDVTLQVAGPKSTILVASRLKKWKSFKLNGEVFKIFRYSDYDSVSLVNIRLPAKGETLDVKIEISDATNSTELNFKIKRANETVDVPVDKLYIREKNVLVPKIFASLHDVNKNPRFEGSEPSCVEVESNENVLKSIKINETPYSNVVEKEINNTPVWAIAGTLEGVKPSGKDVTLVVEPIDTNTYHPITWTFHIDYKDAEPMRFEYEINGVNSYNLPPKFVQGMKDETEPLIELKSNSLNIKLICGGKIQDIKINDETIQGDKLAIFNSDYILTHSIPINNTEKSIDIKINPADLSVYKPIHLKFRAKGDGTIEKIKATFEEISGDSNLPKATFIDKLTGTDKPLYKSFYETANIVIDLDKYSYDFLCKEVRINGEKPEIEIVKLLFGSLYKIKKSFAVNETTPIDVKIEFVANDGISENLTWNFQLQGGGEKPSLPQSKVKIFKINGKGSYYAPLPKELTDHLIDGSNPVYEFSGNKANIEIGSYEAELIENVIFKLDGTKKHEKAPPTSGYIHTVNYEFQLPDSEAHDVEIVIKPKDKKYTDLVYKFRLKSKG